MVSNTLLSVLASIFYCLPALIDLPFEYKLCEKHSKSEPTFYTKIALSIHRKMINLANGN